MTKKESLRIILRLASLTLFLAMMAVQGISHSPHNFSLFEKKVGISPDSNRVWWDIKIMLEVQGKYEVKEGTIRYKGEYDFIIEWAGFMEEDDGDFLLYKDNSTVKHWTAEETAAYPETTTTLKTNDFSSVPALRMNYILKEKELLILDLFVKGFLVPQNPSAQKIPLILPASAENTHIMQFVDYNLHVFKGSNAIMIPENRMSKMPVKQEFTWKWKHQGWQTELKKPTFLSSSHTAKLKITIAEH